MRLTAPCTSQDFTVQDVYGQPVRLSDYRGRRVMLSFFRDAACPFCSFRVHELTHRYPDWHQQGLEILAVFSCSDQEVRRHVSRHPRPFRLITDPDLQLYNDYGVEQSISALFKALLFKLPRIVRSLMVGGRPDPNNPHIRLVPADFLIDEHGKVVDLWYGRDTSDHIPLSRVDAFVQGQNPVSSNAA